MQKSTSRTSFVYLDGWLRRIGRGIRNELSRFVWVSEGRIGRGGGDGVEVHSAFSVEQMNITVKGNKELQYIFPSLETGGGGGG